MDMIRVALGENHPIVGAGKLILETAWHMFADLAPDMLAIEMILAEPVNPPAAERASLTSSSPQVFVLRDCQNSIYVFGMLNHGAATAHTEYDALQIIAEALQVGLDGEANLHSQRIVIQVPPRQLEDQQVAFPNFTAREAEILQQVMAGKTNRAISQNLNISEWTIQYHLKNIYRKLGVTRRSEAIARAFQVGWGK